VRQIEQRILKKARVSFNGDLVKLDIWPADDMDKEGKKERSRLTSSDRFGDKGRSSPRRRSPDVYRGRTAVVQI
jgi:hypothetical protein